MVGVRGYPYGIFDPWVRWVGGGDTPWTLVVAVVISAVSFGAVHIIPQQVFYATLLGLVLGLLAIRTRSIWPGLLFHLTFNAISVIQERMNVAAGGSGVHYDWPVLVPAALVTLALLVKLGRATTPPDTSANSSANPSSSGVPKQASRIESTIGR